VRTPAWASRTSLGQQYWEKGKADLPVIDAHAHMGSWKGIFFPAADAPQMIQNMDRAGVRWVIFSHHAALSSPDVMNSASLAAVRAHPSRLRAYCVFHPAYPEIAAAELAAYDAHLDAYVGLKLHGDMHGVPYNDPRYAPAWEFADRRELPVLVHSWGGSPQNGTPVMREIAGRYPRVKLILGHSLHNHWGEAIAMAREFPRVYLDLCAVLDERTGVLERFVSEADPSRILFGTDLPWFDEHYYIAGVIAADIPEDAMRGILSLNAQKLFGLPA
jgi:uncharacterized protein